MLRRIEWGVQNGPITKNGVLPVISLFFENFISVQELLKKNLLRVLFPCEAL